MGEFRMPSLGADLEQGTLAEWLVHAGDTVHRGDIVAVVETAKVAIEVECVDSGVVERLLVEPGTVVPVGAPLATIATGAVSPPPGAPPLAAVPEVPAAAPAVPVPGGPSPDRSPVVSPERSPVVSPLVRHLAEKRHVDLASVHGSGPGGRVTHADVERSAASPAGSAAPPNGPRSAPPTGPGDAAPGRQRVSPLARRAAAQAGLDLSTITGTGPGGTIGVEDVRHAAGLAAPAGVAVPAGPAAPAGVAAPAVGRPAGPDGPSPVPAAGRTDRATATRAAVAALMARSQREIPHYYLSETVDLGPAVDWLTARNGQLPASHRLVPAALLLKAGALAAREVPGLNGFWVDDRFVPANRVHLGVAVCMRGGGLVAPAIHDATSLDLDQLMARLRDLVARARARRLRRDELADPTITVSNLGDQGVESILGVIYPPQVALVGFGRIADRPWAVDGLLGVRPTVTVSLAADHRATDGATGARYLRTLGQLLHAPEEL